MNLSINLNGKWRGIYVYGRAYGRLAGRSNGFTLDLKDNGGIVTGTCVDDDAEGLFSVPITIKGMFSGGTISFVKKYPQKYYVDEDGKKYLSDEPGHEVKYEGRARQRWIFGRWFFKGSWRIEYSFTDENGGEIPVKVDGKWKMHRVD